MKRPGDGLNIHFRKSASSLNERGAWKSKVLPDTSIVSPSPVLYYCKLGFVWILIDLGIVLWSYRPSDTTTTLQSPEDTNHTRKKNKKYRLSVAQLIAGYCGSSGLRPLLLHLSQTISNFCFDLELKSFYISCIVNLLSYSTPYLSKLRRHSSP
jgi:hypothetical protein